MLQHLLLIQEDPSDARAVRQALSNAADEPFEVIWVRSLGAGLDRLGKGEQPTPTCEPAIAAILMDLALPDGRGIEELSTAAACGARHSRSGAMRARG